MLRVAVRMLLSEWIFSGHIEETNVSQSDLLVLSLFILVMIYRVLLRHQHSTVVSYDLYEIDAIVMACQ